MKFATFLELAEAYGCYATNIKQTDTWILALSGKALGQPTAYISVTVDYVVSQVSLLGSEVDVVEKLCNELKTKCGNDTASSKLTKAQPAHFHLAWDNSKPGSSADHPFWLSAADASPFAVWLSGMFTKAGVSPGAGDHYLPDASLWTDQTYAKCPLECGFYEAATNPAQKNPLKIHVTEKCARITHPSGDEVNINLTPDTQTHWLLSKTNSGVSVLAPSPPKAWSKDFDYFQTPETEALYSKYANKTIDPGLYGKLTLSEGEALGNSPDAETVKDHYGKIVPSKPPTFGMNDFFMNGEAEAQADAVFKMMYAAETKPKKKAILKKPGPGKAKPVALNVKALNPVLVHADFKAMEETIAKSLVGQVQELNQSYTKSMLAMQSSFSAAVKKSQTLGNYSEADAKAVQAILKENHSKFLCGEVSVTPDGYSFKPDVGQSSLVADLIKSGELDITSKKYPYSKAHYPDAYPHKGAQ